MKKPQAFGSSYFIGESHFEEDGTQNCLVFQAINKYFQGINNSEYVLEWKSKGVSDKSIKPPSAPNDFIDSSLGYFGDKIRVKFSGSCLKQNTITYNHGNIVNIYIVYEIMILAVIQH